MEDLQSFFYYFKDILSLNLVYYLVPTLTFGTVVNPFINLFQELTKIFYTPFYTSSIWGFPPKIPIGILDFRLLDTLGRGLPATRVAVGVHTAVATTGMDVNTAGSIRIRAGNRRPTAASVRTTRTCITTREEMI